MRMFVCLQVAKKEPVRICCHYSIAIAHGVYRSCLLYTSDKLPADAREQLVVVERNTNRMLRLVNQILDFRKIQNKKMKMQVQQLNVCLLYTSRCV